MDGAGDASTDSTDGTDGGDASIDAPEDRVLPTDPPAACANSVRDPLESGIDCGGPCPPCDACAGPAGSLRCQCHLAWYSPIAGPTQFYDVAAIAPNFVVAASRYGYAFWDGARWSVGHQDQSFHAAGGTSESDLWLGASGVFWHWDGAAWSTHPSGGGTVFRILAFAPDDAWAVGQSGYVGHWDGTDWNVIASGATDTLYALWGTSSASLYLGGSAGRLTHLVNGVVDTTQSISTNAITDLWGASETDIIATAGSSATYRYDGSSWNTYSTLPVRANVIDGTSSANLYTLGFDVGHSDGTTWSVLTRPLNLLDSIGSWGAGEGDIDIIGNEVFAAHNGTIIHFSGLAPDGPAVTTATVNTLFAVSPTDVYAGGAGGLLHFDGSAWSQVGFPTTSIAGIWAGGGEVFVASGRVYRKQGPTWVDSGVSGSTIWGTSPTNVFLVGAGGSIQRWDGSGWTSTTSPTTQNLTCINGTTDGTIVAGGAAGTVLRYTLSGGWQLLPPAAANGINFIWATGPDDIWVVDAGGLIYQWDGASWTQHSLVPLRGAFGLAGLNGRPIVSDGLNGLMQWDGVTWEGIGGGGCPGPIFNMKLHAADGALWVYGFNGTLGRFVP